MPNGPLNGILIVALEQAVAAPYCTRRLGDAGARVIKIERREGDFARHYDQDVNGESANFLWLNRGKESLELDIKNRDEAALLHRILGKADVFIQNLAPGACGRNGFDLETLRKNNPQLITCSISGYGEEGPYSTMKAYDLLVQGETALCSLTGSASEPGRVGVSVCDIAAGMNASEAILKALIARGKTGQGQHLEVSLFDAMADWMSVPYLQYTYSGKIPKRVGVAHPTIAPYGAFRCRDGVDVILAIQNEREWARFCDVVLEKPHLAKKEEFSSAVKRVENRNDLDKAVSEVFYTCDHVEMCKRLDRGTIAYGRLNDLPAFCSHQALKTVTLDGPSGPFKMPTSVTDNRTGSDAYGPVPSLGQHTRAIKAEFAAP